MKSAQVESDTSYYMTICAGQRSFFIQNELKKMIKCHNSYSYLFKNTDRLKIFQFTLSWTVAELDHNGLLVSLQHGAKILLRNLNLFISTLLGS